MADWDSGSPADNAIVSQYPANERAARAAVLTNFGVDHHATDDADVGKHVQVTLLNRTGDPTAAAGQGFLYAKAVSSQAELFWRSSTGAAVQLTVQGGLNPAGVHATSGMSVLARAANSAGAMALLAAGTDHQVLRRSGTSIAFGAVNLAQSAAVTGVLPEANVGNLSTSKITSGTFANARISQASVTQHQAALALAASQTTSGTFADARIPNLNASKITAGTLVVARGGTGQTSELAFTRRVTLNWTIASDPGGTPSGTAGDVWAYY